MSVHQTEEYHVFAKGNVAANYEALHDLASDEGVSFEFSSDDDSGVFETFYSEEDADEFDRRVEEILNN